MNDVKSALDAMECLTEEGRKINHSVAPGNFNGPYLPFPMPGTPTLKESFHPAGHSLGGNVALHTAAMDNRVTQLHLLRFTPLKRIGTTDDWRNQTIV